MTEIESSKTRSIIISSDVCPSDVMSRPDLGKLSATQLLEPNEKAVFLCFGHEEFFDLQKSSVMDESGDGQQFKSVDAASIELNKEERKLETIREQEQSPADIMRLRSSKRSINRQSHDSSYRNQESRKSKEQITELSSEMHVNLPPVDLT
jgi:hypothetical protein